VLGVTLYKKNVSKGKWLCLIPVIGGVILASVKELDFAWAALITACIANLFAAFKGQENQKLMSTPGISVFPSTPAHAATLPAARASLTPEPRTTGSPRECWQPIRFHHPPGFPHLCARDDCQGGLQVGRILRPLG